MEQINQAVQKKRAMAVKLRQNSPKKTVAKADDEASGMVSAVAPAGAHGRLGNSVRLPANYTVLRE